MSAKNERDLLRQWKLDAPLPPRFNATVWQRIQAEQAARPAQLFLAWLQGLFARPAAAVAYAAIALLVGLISGHFRASNVLVTEKIQMEARYVHSVAPYAQVRIP